MATLGVGGLAAAVQPRGRAAEAGGAAPATVPIGVAKLTVAEVYANARKALDGTCNVCDQCDGVYCAGRSPGIGGDGSGMSFQNNFTALQRVRLKMRTLVDDPALAEKPDTSTTIFGRKLSFPALAAPIGPVVLQFGRGIDKNRYFDAIIGGCVDAGAAGGIGDNAALPREVFKAHCDYVAAVKGQALFGMKPRPAARMIDLLPLVEASGALMITIDTDTGGRYPLADLRAVVRATRLPVVVKGVMTIDDALKAGDAGAAGIVVSNHGGRRLDHTPGTAEVLPGIADRVKGRLTIFADGCVRYGPDVLKYLALGADAVLVGRHLVRAAFGGGRAGVGLFMNVMRDELAATMSLTAVPSIARINRDILA